MDAVARRAEALKLAVKTLQNNDITDFGEAVNTILSLAQRYDWYLQFDQTTIPPHVKL